MRFQPLRPWITGHNSVTPEIFYGMKDPDLTKEAFIGLDICVDLHDSNEVDTGNLQDSWTENREYIERALELVSINLNECGSDLDHEERIRIQQELGEPPYSSYNLYFITIYKEEVNQGQSKIIEERIVYIGKTDSKNSRFVNGHLVALKLHHPKYQDFKKRVYFGTVTFLTEEDDYLPLEFIYQLTKAKELLNNTEALLISWFNPELNIRTEDMGNMRCCSICIENWSEKSNFLHGYFVEGYEK
ncbi:MAG: hypothetical protein ACOYVD_16355 [Bacillota bacterium]